MDQNKIKEYMLRMEGVAEGIKFGSSETIKWFINEMEKDKAAQAPQPQPETPKTGE